MYATAHHVRSARGLVGVNCFLHQHDTADVEGIGASLNFEMITQHNPGRLVAVDYEVSPGGNTVLAYLDLVCPDGTSFEAISSALGHARTALDTSIRPLRRRFPHKIGVQFGAVLGLDPAGERREYDTLSERLHRLLLHPSPLPWEQHAPLIVEAVRTQDSVTFRLAAESRNRVAHASPFPLPVGAISASVDTIEAFESYHGDLLRTILPTLLELPLEEIARMGGVRVLAMPEERILWEWPRRAPKPSAPAP